MKGDFNIMEEEYTVIFVKSNMRSDLAKIRSDLSEIAEAEATKLYRLAWRMVAHGCKDESIRKCREEAEFLHMCAYPERLITGDIKWTYAFKI